MSHAPDAICYHGRRSVDELADALAAKTAAAARIHKELSLLHLDRFVRMMAATAAAIAEDRGT